MDSLMEKLPKNLSSYLMGLMTEEGFTTVDKKDRFVKNWIKKRALFDKIVEHNGFIIAESLGVDCRAPIILITYSGSLLTISGEKQDNTRDVVYESIKLRRDNFPETEEQSITIDFPIQLNKPVNVNGGKVVRTSPVFSLAVQKKEEANPVDIQKNFAILRDKISKALLQVNNTIFSKADEVSLENREDLFLKWVVPSWFRINGWKAEVFLARVRLLWIELFQKVYESCISGINGSDKQEKAFLEMSNNQFTRYCENHKIQGPEQKDIDISLLYALEKIPTQKEYTDFIDNSIRRFPMKNE